MDVDLLKVLEDFDFGCLAGEKVRENGGGWGLEEEEVGDFVELGCDDVFSNDK